VAFDAFECGAKDNGSTEVTFFSIEAVDMHAQKTFHVTFHK